MTPEQFAEIMKEIDSDTTKSTADRHIYADSLMCALLRELGYGEGVDIFEDMYIYYE